MPENDTLLYALAELTLWTERVQVTADEHQKCVMREDLEGAQTMAYLHAISVTAQMIAKDLVADSLRSIRN